MAKTRPTTGARRRTSGQILAILSVGCSQSMAAQYVGCASRTIQRTAERDPEFAKRTRQAKCNAELGLVTKHPQRGEEGAILAGGGLGAGTRLSRKVRPPRPRRHHRRATGQIGNLLSGFSAIIVRTKYRKNIVKRGSLASLGRPLAVAQVCGIETRKREKRPPMSRHESQ